MKIKIITNLITIIINIYIKIIQWTINKYVSEQILYPLLWFLIQSFLIWLTTWTVPIKTREDTEVIADAYRQEIYLTNLLLHTVQGTVSMFRNVVFSYWIFPSQIMIFHVRIHLSKTISAIYWNMEFRFRVSKLIFSEESQGWRRKKF